MFLLLTIDNAHGSFRPYIKIFRKYNDKAIVLRVFDAIRIFPGIHHTGHK